MIQVGGGDTHLLVGRELGEPIQTKGETLVTYGTLYTNPFSLLARMPATSWVLRYDS